MLLKQLSDNDKRIFLRLAELVSLCDRPMLWNGKLREVATTADFKADAISLEWDMQVFEAMKELASVLIGDADFKTVDMPKPVADRSAAAWFGLHQTSVSEELIRRLEAKPLTAGGDSAVRVTVATDILREILKDHKAATPSLPKLMLFELFLLSLASGSISSVQWQVLSEFKHHHQLEDYIVDDLLARAQSTHLEAQKTLAIILE